MSKTAGPVKKTSTVAEPPGQYTWRVRRKLDGADTPWKQGGPAEIMEVVLRRLEILESFEKSTLEIEKRINALDKNILAVAKEIMPYEKLFMPAPPKEPTPPPTPAPPPPPASESETIMPRPAGAPAPPPSAEPILAKEEAKPVAAGAAAAGAPAAAAAKVGVKKSFLKSK